MSDPKIDSVTTDLFINLFGPQTTMHPIKGDRPPVPDDAEAFPCHQFLDRIPVPSLIVPGKSVMTERMRCPVCERAGRTLGHGERVMCSGCFLYLELYGNGLKIWRGKQ